METVKQVASRLGVETAIPWADHRIECLEAEVRSNLQALRALSDAVLAGDSTFAESMAKAVRDLLREKMKAGHG